MCVLFHRGILALLFLITVAYQARHVRFVIDYVTGRVGAVSVPITVRQGSPVIGSVNAEAKEAGVRPGDTLVAVNGQTYRSNAVLNRALKHAQPGDELSVTVRRQTVPASEETVRVLLIPKAAIASDQWFFVMVIGLFFPLACVSLGFWVAAVRPRDALAWLLLALLLSSSQLFIIGGENGEGTAGSNLAMAYQVLFSQTWFIWLFLLALYFPTRLSLERRAPWLKWLLVIPLGVRAALQLIFMVGLQQDYAFASLLDRAPGFVGPLLNPLLGPSLPLVAILLFFVLIGARYFLEPTRDARRRLRLLYAGTSLALLPTLALLVIGGATGKSLDDFPAWVELPCLMLTLLFPLTLAHLIVIHKAMDVSVVVRQGVQYALARGGVTVFQGLLTAALL
ncbi:MAG TPA: PDZ domain-containing protein, partial [Blastocatellia bacterium]|nr:PDZ domain-containing protein [Blastocatellia bacterium]